MAQSLMRTRPGPRGTRPKPIPRRGQPGVSGSVYLNLVEPQVDYQEAIAMRLFCVSIAFL